ncbi:Oidioi.mRNA.OKI2018_I69.PAR.g10664.t1.cds [Oikopleura dioica]|uniref:Oidioi.mRNA.OKI2018_I69.PAR.g10664.t1.cds n=1 Tax=Oikopleura dioica TaxID=34765 RepID=A0ABN7RXF6_OIKDI|nr:Oidioi.mRNA.OKI2018_I69.PAR.g10664.t1.cds [Oikopleura dioica]
MESLLNFSWRLPEEIKEDYLSGKLNSIYFVSADETRKIGLGPYYPPLFCQYTRKWNFSYEIVKAYADYLHEIDIKLKCLNDWVQMLEFACYIGRKDLLDKALAHLCEVQEGFKISA